MSFPWAEQYKPKHPLMRWFDDRLPLPRLTAGLSHPSAVLRPGPAMTVIRGTTVSEYGVQHGN